MGIYICFCNFFISLYFYISYYLFFKLNVCYKIVYTEICISNNPRGVAKNKFTLLYFTLLYQIIVFLFSCII